jgi:hypothetical protein
VLSPEHRERHCRNNATSFHTGSLLCSKTSL